VEVIEIIVIVDQLQVLTAEKMVEEEVLKWGGGGGLGFGRIPGRSNHVWAFLFLTI